jgi:transposase
MRASGRINIAELIELHQTTLLSYRQLGIKYGVSHETVRKTLREAGIQKRRRGSRKKVEQTLGRPVFKDFDNEAIRAEWESGKSVKKLAEVRDCSPSVIYRCLNRTKKEGEGRLTRDKYVKRNQEIRDHYQYISSDLASMAELFNLTTVRVRQILK